MDAMLRKTIQNVVGTRAIRGSVIVRNTSQSVERLGLALVIFTLSVAACFPRVDAAPRQGDPNMPPDMARYIVGIIRKGPAWTGDVNARTTAMQKAHRANIRRMAQEGTLSLAGPFEGGEDLRGLFIFNVQTLEEAQSLVETDPAVQANHLVVDLIPWWGPASLAQLPAFSN